MNQIIAVIGILLLAWLVFIIKNKKQMRLVQSRRIGIKDVQTIFDEYGEPDELIVLDATRAGEVEAVVVVYKRKGFWVINGSPISQSAIVDITFNNASTPYGIDDYQIVLRTTQDDTPYIWLHVGNDRNRTKEIFEKIQASLIK